MVKIEIVAVGDEILSGNTVNTNVTLLSEALKKAGYLVSRHTVLPDNEILLGQGFREILKRADVVISTGGIGPTFDDKTKQVAATLFDSKLILDKALAKTLFKKFGKNKYIEEQAKILQKAKILKNEIGNAPGFVLEKAKKMLILLPGVPYELEKMFFSSALGYLQKKYPLKEKIFQQGVNICLKKETEVEPVLEKLRKLNKEIDIGIYPSFANLKVSFTLKGKNAKKASSLIHPLKQKLEKEFKEFIFSSENNRIEEALRDLFTLKKKKLVLAESCSGGAMAAALTSVPNSSLFFLGSLVTYSNDLKKGILKVSEKTLKNKGAVSGETVKEMIDGIFKITPADYALAISGIAGPGGGSAKKPVGTVWIALGERGKKTEVGLMPIVSQDRSFIIKYSVNFALSLLWRKVKTGLNYFS